MSKRIIAFLLVFAMFFTFIPFVGMAAAPKYNAVVSIDGVKVGFTNKPYVQGDTLFVPVEELAGYLKFTTKGNDYGTGITIKNGDVEALLQNGNMFVDTTAGNVQLKDAPVFEKGVFYAPIDIFSDVFNFPLTQDVDNRTANITSGYYRFEISEENAAVVSVDEPDKDILNTSATGSDQLVYNEISEPPQEISAFYKFDMSQIAGKKIKSATMVYNAARGGQYTPTPRFVKADNWDKATINYNNQPKTYPEIKADGERIPGSLRTGTFQDWSVDITSLVTPSEENPIVSMKVYGMTYQSATTVNTMRTVQVNMKGVNTPQKAYIEVICDEQLSFPAYTEEVLSVTEQNAFDQVSALTKIGILTTEDEFPSEIAESVNRAEFVKYAVRLLNDKFDYTPENGDYFVDVDKESDYYDAINTAVANKVVALDDEGQFRPDDLITPIEAIIIVDRILGYEDYARHNQNYPTGYILVAQQAGLLEKVNTAGDEFSYKDMFQLLFNAISAPKMSIIAYSSTGEAIYDFDESKTVMSEEFDAYEVDGILSANNYTDLDYTKATNDTTIKIDSTEYYSLNDEYNDLLGYKVTAYYKENDAGRNEIVYVGLNKNNSASVIDYEDIYSVTPNSEGFLVKYETADDDEEVQIYTSKPIIYNGKAIAPNQLTQAMLNGDIGALTLVSNGGADYDVLFIESYKTIIANGIDVDNGIVFDRYNSALRLTTKGRDFFTLKKGTRNLGISEIIKGDVISYAESLDGKVVKAYLSNSIMNGEIQSILKENGLIEKITIKGVDFVLENHHVDWTQDLAPGLSGTFFFDNFGNIVNFETNEISGKFGVVIGVDISSRISKDVSIAIHNGDSEEYRIYKVADKVKVTDVNDLDNYNENTVPASELKGFFYTNDQLTTAKQGIMYSLNSNKEISEISTLYFTDYTNAEAYKGTGQLWYKNSKFEDYFYINSNTLKFYEPSGLDNTVLEDYEVIMGSFTGDETYSGIKTYTTDTEKAVVDVVMLPAPNDSSSVSATSGLSIVTNIVSAVDEEGDLIKKISLSEAGTEKTFTVAHEYANASLFNTIQIGDIVRYGTNYKNEINCVGTLDSQIALKKIYDYSSKGFVSANLNTGMNQEIRIYGGYVYDKDGEYVKFVDAKKYETAANKDISTYDAIADYSMFRWYNFPNGAKLYKYKVKNSGRTVEVNSATSNDMITYKDLGYAASGILIQSRYETLTGAYIVELVKSENTGKLAAPFIGGTGSIGNYTVSFDEGETVTVTAPSGRDGNIKFTKPGYKIVSWTDTNGVTYNVGDPITIDSEITFTANWVPAYFIKHNGGNGASGSMEDKLIEGDNFTYTIPANEFTNEGYEFVHWTNGIRTYNPGETITVNDGADVVLTAVWNRLSYIEFNSNGGTGSMNKVYIQSAGDITLPYNTFAKDGYVFDCWSDGVNTYGDGATITVDNTSDVTLTANWIAETDPSISTVTFNTGVGSVSPIKVKSGNSIVLPTPENSGSYAFAGWTSDNGATIKAGGETTVVSGDTTFEAVWTIKLNFTNWAKITTSNVAYVNDETMTTDRTIGDRLYFEFGTNGIDSVTDIVDVKVIFNRYHKYNATSMTTYESSELSSQLLATADGSTVEESILPVTGSVISTKTASNTSSDSASLTDALIDNDVFEQYLKNEITSGKTKVGFMMKDTFTGNTANGIAMRFYPASSYVEVKLLASGLPSATVTYSFDGNGNTGGTAPNGGTVNRGSLITFPANTFEKTGYTFAGWTDDTNDYVVGSSIALTSNKVFKAKWEPIIIYLDVTYKANGGVGADIETQEASNSTFTLPDCTFTNAGLEFAGWNDGTNTYPAGESYTIGMNNVIFNAQWSTLYNVTFEGGAGATGTAPESLRRAEGITITLPENTFTKDGSIFAGWNDGTTTYNAGAPYTMPASNVTFTAQWTEGKTITYKTLSGTETQTVLAGTAVTLETGTNSGDYTFAGWTINGTDIVTSVTANNDITLVGMYTYKANISDWALYNGTDTVTRKPNASSGYTNLGRNKDIIVFAEIALPEIDGSKISKVEYTLNQNHKYNATVLNVYEVPDGMGNVIKALSSGESAVVTSTDIPALVNGNLINTLGMTNTSVDTFSDRTDLINSDTVTAKIRTALDNDEDTFTLGLQSYQSGKTPQTDAIRIKFYNSYATFTILADTVAVPNYTAKFLDDDTTTEIETAQTVASGTTITLPTPTKTGYDFVKWTLNGQDYTEATYTVTGNVDFVAVWEVAAVQYTLTFTGNEGDVLSGTAIAPVTQNENTTFEIPANVYAVPTAVAGSYAFGGWTDGTTTVWPGEVVTLTANKTYKPVWTYTGTGNSGAVLNAAETWYSSEVKGTAAVNPNYQSATAGDIVAYTSENYLTLMKNRASYAFVKVDLTGIKADNLSSAVLTINYDQIKAASKVVVEGVTEAAYNVAFPLSGTKTLPAVESTALFTSDQLSTSTTAGTVETTDIAEYIKAKITAGQKAVYLRVSFNDGGTGANNGFRFNGATLKVVTE